MEMNCLDEVVRYLSVSISTFIVAEAFLLLLCIPQFRYIFGPFMERFRGHQMLQLEFAEMAERYAYIGIYHNEWEDGGVRHELSRLRNQAVVRGTTLVLGIVLSPIVLNTALNAFE